MEWWWNSGMVVDGGIVEWWWNSGMVVDGGMVVE